MASIKLTGDTSGEITISAPAVAGTNTLTLPANTGTIVTSESGVGDLPSTIAGPAFSAYMGSDLSLTSSTYTKVPIDTEDFDTSSDFDTSTYRFTPSVEGYYQINGTVRGIGTSRSTFLLAFYKNGSSHKVVTLNREASSSSAVISSSILVYMNGSTDYLELYSYMDFSSGGRLDYAATKDSCFFSAFLARAV